MPARRSPARRRSRSREARGVRLSNEFACVLRVFRREGGECDWRLGSRRRSLCAGMAGLAAKRVKELIEGAGRANILVVGDLMLDQFVWGQVHRISPEAPVPVVEFERESFMPGGAANVARNVTALGGSAELFGVIGPDSAGEKLKELLVAEGVGCDGLLAADSRPTSTKTRIVAHQQQVARLDREVRTELGEPDVRRLLDRIDAAMESADAVIVADYAKGVVTQGLLDALKVRCRRGGQWLSLDPKPSRSLAAEGVSLLTPNRREAFALAQAVDSTRNADPLQDPALLAAAEGLLQKLRPAVLLVTLGELGMLLCRRDQRPRHIPTVAREVFDVSGAGDTVIASYTLAIAAGASPAEAAILSNHAAGVVVGKVGTATVAPRELLASFAGGG